MLVLIAMLSGPRRTALAVGIAVAVASLATTRYSGPRQPYQLQTFLALSVLPVLLLQAVMAERDNAIEKARTSDERYRAFVAHSSERFSAPSSPNPCRDHSRPTNRLPGCANTVRGGVQYRVHGGARREGCSEPDRRYPLGDHPTCLRSYIERIREAIRNATRFGHRTLVHGPYGLDRVLLISMIGIVANGHVLRFWGAAAT